MGRTNLPKNLPAQIFLLVNLMKTICHSGQEDLFQGPFYFQKAQPLLSWTVSVAVVCIGLSPGSKLCYPETFYLFHLPFCLSKQDQRLRCIPTQKVLL